MLPSTTSNWPGNTPVPTVRTCQSFVNAVCFVSSQLMTFSAVRLGAGALLSARWGMLGEGHVARWPASGPVHTHQLSRRREDTSDVLSYPLCWAMSAARHGTARCTRGSLAARLTRAPRASSGHAQCTAPAHCVLQRTRLPSRRAIDAKTWSNASPRPWFGCGEPACGARRLGLFHARLPGGRIGRMCGRVSGGIWHGRSYRDGGRLVHLADRRSHKFGIRIRVIRIQWPG